LISSAQFFDRLRNNAFCAKLVGMKGGKKRAARRRILMLADFSYASAKAIASGAIQFVSTRPGLELLLEGAHPQNKDLEYAGDMVADGVISCMGTKASLLQRVMKANPRSPVVFASLVRDLSTVKGRPTCSLRCDNAAIAEAAAALFLRHDLAHFAYVGARSGASTNYFDGERCEGYVRTLATRGFAPNLYKPPPASAGADAEFASLGAWLRALPKPCGLFVSYDQRAMHVLNVCRAEGIAIPEQVQVVSADNEEWICEHTSPTLTSVEPDFEGCGHRAAELLLHLMAGRKCEPVETFGVKGVEQRMSTTDMHGSVNRAVHARKFLREHAAEPLAGSTLAAHLGCSPRTLQLSYKAVFGRTVQDDLADARLDLAKKLLSDTDIPVCDIPEHCGFASPNHLMRLFRRRTGMTMLQWRRR